MRVLWWELFPKNSNNVHPVCETTIYYPVIILKFKKLWYLSQKNLISVSPGVIFLTGHMNGQPFNLVNLLVNSWSSQCCQYLTLMTIMGRKIMLPSLPIAVSIDRRPIAVCSCSLCRGGVGWVYRARLKGGFQVAWMKQAKPGRCGKQELHCNKIHQTWPKPFSRAQ